MPSTAAPVTTVEETRETLGAQVCASVLWERSMRGALERGTTRFIEPGPGTTLAGILRKIEPEATVVAANAPEDLDAALAAAVG